MSRDDESLKVVDTSNVLTKEELLELKRLANLSKTAKFIVSILFGAITLLGADHLVEWIERAK